MRKRSLGTTGVDIDAGDYLDTMRLPAVPAVLLAALAVTTAAARAESGDVLIQAGHEGRPAHCLQLGFDATRCGRTGAAFARAGQAAEREIEWTPIVADEATAVLRRHGLHVIRRPADYRTAERDSARAALFLHFDGAATPCTSGASVGYPSTTSAAFVDAWKTSYRALGAPIPFMRDNFTENEHQLLRVPRRRRAAEDAGRARRALVSRAGGVDEAAPAARWATASPRS